MPRTLQFFSETSFFLKDSASVKDWIKQVLHGRGCTSYEIHYVFVEKSRIKEINISFLQHEFFTDIITFDYSVGEQLKAEIYVCPEVVVENAEEWNYTFQEEILRVIIHGVLHIIGYKDGTDSEKIEMRRAEDEALGLYL